MKGGKGINGVVFQGSRKNEAEPKFLRERGGTTKRAEVTPNRCDGASAVCPDEDMAKERVFTYRNVGTAEEPVWEKYYIKTTADAVLMTDGDEETKNIQQYIDEEIAGLVNGAPETLDTLKEVADAIQENESVVDGLNAAIGNKADKDHTHTDATGAAAGFMSATDKAKLDGMTAGAEPNQNAFANVKVGDTTVAAAAETDTVEFVAGSNISISADAETKKVTITAQGQTNVEHATLADKATKLETPRSINVTGGVTATAASFDGSADVNIEVTAVDGTKVTGLADVAKSGAYDDLTGVPVAATTSADGLMSSTDKTKLDGIEEGANNYVHPSNHPASMITEDATHRFATDAEKAEWNGKANVVFASELPATAAVGTICFLIS